jgi:hypothetical protein
MGRHGWIVKRHGEDRREWRMRLSKAGETQFKMRCPTGKVRKHGYAAN